MYVCIVDQRSSATLEAKAHAMLEAKRTGRECVRVCMCVCGSGSQWSIIITHVRNKIKFNKRNKMDQKLNQNKTNQCDYFTQPRDVEHYFKIF